MLGPEFHLIVSDRPAPSGASLGSREARVHIQAAPRAAHGGRDRHYLRPNEGAGHDRGELRRILERDGAVRREAAGVPGRAGAASPESGLPMFLTFIRQPFCVSFRINGHPGTAPYENNGDQRSPLLRPIHHRPAPGVRGADGVDYRTGRDEPQGLLPELPAHGGPEPGLRQPRERRGRIEGYLKTFNNRSGDAVNVYFPFLDPHPPQPEPFRTNARLTETFDQIGLFSRDRRLPTFTDNASWPGRSRPRLRRVRARFNLFSDAVLGVPFSSLTGRPRSDFLARFEHKVSDHMPLWMRLPSAG